MKQTKLKKAYELLNEAIPLCDDLDYQRLVQVAANMLKPKIKQQWQDSAKTITEAQEHGKRERSSVEW